MTFGKCKTVLDNEFQSRAANFSLYCSIQDQPPHSGKPHNVVNAAEQHIKHAV